MMRFLSICFIILISLSSCNEKYKENIQLAQSSFDAPPTDWVETNSKSYSTMVEIPEIKGVFRVDWTSSIKDNQNSIIKLCSVTLVKALDKFDITASISKEQWNSGTLDKIQTFSSLMIEYAGSSATQTSSGSKSITFRSNGESAVQ